MNASWLRRMRAAGEPLPSFTSTGSYTVAYLTADGGILCGACARGENGSEAHEDSDDPQWKLVDGSTYDEGPTLQCDHCNGDIESSYGDPDEVPA